MEYEIALDPIRLLASLVAAEGGQRESRSTSLLKAPGQWSKPDWRACVPPAFDSALDIALTERVDREEGVVTRRKVWTQGSAFAFSSGDWLYDSPDAYEAWQLALSTIRFAIRVEDALPARPAQQGQPRFSGRLVLRTFLPGPDRSALVEYGRLTLSQDDLVEWLVGGNSASSQAITDSLRTTVA